MLRVGESTRSVIAAALRLAQEASTASVAEENRCVADTLLLCGRSGLRHVLDQRVRDLRCGSDTLRRLIRLMLRLSRLQELLHGL